MNDLLGFPRHLSQHVGGFVIARGRLDELVPIENARMKDRTVIQWEKDDIDELGMMKVDILGLGMLTAIRKAFELMERHYGRKLTLATIHRKTRRVRDAPECGFHRRLSSGKPGAAKHVAAAQAEGVL